MKVFSKLLIVLILLLITSIIKCNTILPPPAESGFISTSDLLIYLHTDRSYYSPGESVFFKAYVLGHPTNKSSLSEDSLHVALYDQEGNEVAGKLFLIDNSLFSGDFEIPNAISQGNYILVASSGVINDGIPEKIFSKVIEIRQSEIITFLVLDDSLYNPGSTLTAHVSFTREENKPASINFNYVLTGSKGEIASGKGKSDNQGKAVLSIKLPEFDKDEILKLFITPSFKDNPPSTAIIIPTPFNRTSTVNSSAALQSEKLKHLNIQLKTVRLADEKLKLDINVTNDNGVPIMANLSVSASNLVSYLNSSGNENLVTYSYQKHNLPDTEPDIRKYSARTLLRLTQTPGKPFIIQSKNNIKKLHRNTKSNLISTQGYPSERSIFDVIMRIKPYHIENGKITFGVNTMNTINNQDGALIVVDGIKMGTNIEILNSIPVPDIAHINVSTNPMDIQRYTALNNVGLIEIFMKKNFSPEETDEIKTGSNTLCWKPNLITDSSGKATITFSGSNSYNEVLITVEGIAANGLTGSSYQIFK